MVEPVNPLKILVCGHFAREVETILREDGFEDAVCYTFAPSCIRPQQAESILATLGSSLFDDSSKAILVGGCYLSRKKQLDTLPPQVRVHNLENCFYCLVSKEYVDEWLKHGGYLVSPGWLVHWRQTMSQWDFNQKTARAFFHEFTKTLVLLDTGVYADSAVTLKEFADFLDLPFQIVRVGLGHLRLILKRIVLEWRLEQIQKVSAL